MSESSSGSAPSAAPTSTTAASATPAVDTTSQGNSEVADAANEIAGEVSPAEANTPKAPTKEELKEAVKKWKLKSQGKEREVTDEAELVRLAQLGLGAHEKFEKTAKRTKEIERIVDLLQKDPAKALQALGHDVDKLAEQRLNDKAKKLMMTPEEREKADIMDEINRLKSEKENLAKEQREQRIAQLQVKYEADIQDQIIKAIDQYKLPKNPKTVARMAEYMASALENGYEVNALDVAPRVRTDLEDEHKSLYSNYGVEDLIKLLGEDNLKALRQYEINKVKAKAPASPVKTVNIPSKSNSEEKPVSKKISMQEFMDDLEKYTK